MQNVTVLTAVATCRFNELLAALPPAKAATLLELNLAPATGDALADEDTIKRILGEPPVAAPVSAGSRKMLYTNMP